MVKPNPYFTRQNQRGNALVYILIAIALIGVLTVTLARQNELTDNQDISDEEAELLALEMIEYANAAKNVINQMIITGADADNLDFINPTSDTPFNTAPHIDKVFHPQGGGLAYKELNEKAISQNSSDPSASIYFDMFSNVEWTPSTSNDIILAFYQIDSSICEVINEKITGTNTIPALVGAMNTILVADTLHTGTNIDLDTTSCPTCDGYADLCVSNAAVNEYSYYSILLGR